MPGSVMAIAVISSPAQMPGSQRARCWSSSPRLVKYGRQMSLCRVRPSPAALSPARWISSAMTTLKRKSRTPPPPCSSGTSMPRKPAGAGGGEQAPVDDAGLLPLLAVRHRLPLEERAEGRPELLVGVVEQGALHGASHRRVRGAWTIDAPPSTP